MRVVTEMDPVGSFERIFLFFFGVGFLSFFLFLIFFRWRGLSDGWSVTWPTPAITVRPAGQIVFFSLSLSLSLFRSAGGGGRWSISFKNFFLFWLRFYIDSFLFMLMLEMWRTENVLGRGRTVTDGVKEEVGHRKTSNVRANMMDRHYDVI